MTRKILSLLVALMLVGGVAYAEVPAYEDIDFPSSLPGGLYLASELGLDYSYDDLTESYDVEILLSNYGSDRNPHDEDPMALWLEHQFNIHLTITQVLGTDLETLVTTRYAAGTEAEVTMMPSQSVAFELNTAGLTIDAREIYPYMPLNCMYVTDAMIQYTTNSNGELAGITSYAIQDGVWGLVIRADWLEALGMETPTTEQELLDYAHAVTYNDPDGNGVDDTWFMTGAGGGKGFGMLEEFSGAYGNTGSTIDADGTLSHPYFNGARLAYLQFLNKLYNDGVLAPDWYTIEWETAKSYTLNNKIGMVRYPAANIYGEYIGAYGTKDIAVFDNWSVLENYPIEGGKFMPAGNPGNIWAFSKAKIDSDGKLMRIAHMIDTMRMGGENWEDTIQKSTDRAYELMGVEIVSSQVYNYVPNGDGTYMYYVTYTNKDAEGNPQAPYGDWGDKWYGLDPLQIFGLNTCWSISDPNPENEFDKAANAIVNAGTIAIASYDRWENTSMLVTLVDEASEAQAMLKDWVAATELEFVTGVRSFDDWDSYTQEWLEKGGDEIIRQTADCIGASYPAYID